MKKLFLLSLLCLGLTASSFADYLDDWPDDALCGWMDNPSPPSYMVEEVKKRDISCAWGVVINNLPDSLDVVINISNELFVEEEFLPDYPDMQKTTENTRESWLSTYGIKPEDLSPMLLELSKETQAIVQECTDDFCFTMQPVYRAEATKEFTPETWLSEFELKPEDLSPMLLELAKETQAIVPECTTDFCFTTQEETGYGGNGLRWGNGDKILNKGDLINAFYRANDTSQGSDYRERNYCNDIGCFPIRKKLVKMVDPENKWSKGTGTKAYIQGLFPDGAGNTTSVNHIGYDACDTCSRGKLTPDSWLLQNGLTIEDVINMLGDSPTTFRIDYRKKTGRTLSGWIEEPRLCKDWGTGHGFKCNDAPKWGNTFEGTRDGECTFEHTCAGEEIELEVMYADVEIINTDQLLQSLLFLDPNAIDPNLIHKWEGQNKIVEYTPSDEIINTDQLLQSLLFWDPEVLGILDYTYGCIVGQDEGCTLDPNPLGYKTKTIWEGPDKIVTYFEHECTDKMSGGEQINWKCQVLMGMVAPAGGECDPTPEKPCIENAVPTPLEPTPPVPIRPGWKIAEGSNFWSIDEDDPYWQTEEGIEKNEAAKKRGSWIETEASRYARENPGVDAPIPSYYATDSCGEGKQPANSSC